ncbi:MAG TPA: UDP-N-acetylmuramoyl-L-alanyl-D-glutamate--2,6-diaminopimelate ligase [Clostridiales bacterium]|nr:UDP-N-acetylmuramoyl-L-alanyl-D-glutamate--2,6-diaminopimelate ligase [Clostridiales bacterium]
MKLKDILKDIEIIEFCADPEMEIGGICYDSRHVKTGDLFVAVSGFETDGHKYINSAFENGAVAVLCQKAPDGGLPYVQVKDSRYALAIVSKNFFRSPSSEMVMIGVTGTNGKTTTTTLIKHMLEHCLNAKVGLVGTNENMIGYTALPAERTTPESYELQKLLREMADAGCTHVVMEVSSHSLVLSRVAGITFQVGIFTNLTQDHLDFHRTMEEYAKAKALFFRQCEKGAVNLDDQWAEYMLREAKCPVLTYSTEKNEATLVAKDIRLYAGEVKFCALTTGVLERVRLGVPGRFSVYNALAVIACGLLLGISSGRVAEALSAAKGVKGRVEVVPTDGDYTILIDYAHTPDALENVLKSMKEVSPGRLVVLFGCGGDRDRTKRPIMGKIAAEYADFVIITSDNPRTEDPLGIIADIMSGLEDSKTPRTIIENRREAIAYAINNHRPGDIIILAGKGHETYQIIGKTKHHMDEREIVAEILEKRKNQ